MDFKARSEAAEQKRTDDQLRRQQQYERRRGVGLLDEVPPPIFESANMVEDTWFKADQRGKAQTALISEYPFPSEFPADEDLIDFERKRRSQPETEYQRLGPTVKVSNVAGNFPIPIVMPEEYMLDEGEFDFRFHVQTYNGSFADSRPAAAILDWTAPGEREELLAPVVYPFDRETHLIDDAYIDGLGEGLVVEIPVYANEAPGDDIIWAWVGRVPDDGAMPPTLKEEPLVDRKVTIPKQVILDTAEVNGRCYFFYLLRDKAGNTSRLSQALPVRVAKGPVPGPIADPRVPLANPKLEYADIAQGISVIVGPIGDYFRPGDVIVVTWGDTDLPDIPLTGGIGFPLEVPVPDGVLRSEYPESATGDVAIKLSYAVWRGYNAWPSAEIDVITNFATVGPPNPDWPAPVNPDLPWVTLEPASGENNTIVGEENLDQEATLVFDLYDGAKEGDIIQAYWRDVAVGEPHEVKSDDIGKQIRITIPWQAISNGGNDLELPASYSIRGADPENNQLWCKPTLIKVLVLDIVLIAPSFPQTETDDNPNKVINCSIAHMDFGRVWVKIPDNPDFFKDGETVVTVYWRGYKRDPATGGLGDPVDISNYQVDIIWSHSADIAKVEPAEDRLFTLHGVSPGSGWCQCYYSIETAGGTVTSAIKQNLVSMGTPNGLCAIPPKP